VIRDCTYIMTKSKKNGAVVKPPKPAAAKIGPKAAAAKSGMAKFLTAQGKENNRCGTPTFEQGQKRGRSPAPVQISSAMAGNSTNLQAPGKRKRKEPVRSVISQHLRQ
jgi:hypothetical protein